MEGNTKNRRDDNVVVLLGAQGDDAVSGRLRLWAVETYTVLLRRFGDSMGLANRFKWLLND